MKNQTSVNYTSTQIQKGSMEGLTFFQKMQPTLTNTIITLIT